MLSFVLVFVKGGVMVVNHGGTTHMLGKGGEETILPQSREKVGGRPVRCLLFAFCWVCVDVCVCVCVWGGGV